MGYRNDVILIECLTVVEELYHHSVLSCLLLLIGGPTLHNCLVFVCKLFLVTKITSNRISELFVTSRNPGDSTSVDQWKAS